jgi:hypothetical protein
MSTATHQLVRIATIAACIVSLGAMQMTPPTSGFAAVPQSLNMPTTEDAEALGSQISEQLTRQLTENPLPADDAARIGALQGLSQSSSVAEWLGPMAPIAISPFFGIACLAAVSQHGGDFVPGNAFLSNNGVLQNPTVLWVFVFLTLLTSLPRLTKVSKPIAQAIDQLETYAGIITIIVIRLSMGSLGADDGSPEIAAASTTALATVPVVQMGLFSVTADALLSVAAIINILVINSVKFFFEVMVWLTPFPFIDALLEAANKSLCAGLIAIYAYSPTVATIINLSLFVACLVAYQWTRRRVHWYRCVLLDPIWSRLKPSFAQPQPNAPLVAFAKNSFGPFPAKARIEVEKNEDGWTLRQRRFLIGDRVLEISRPNCQISLRRGIVTNQLKVTGVEQANLLITQRHANHLSELCDGYSFEGLNLEPLKLALA